MRKLWALFVVPPMERISEGRGHGPKSVMWQGCVTVFRCDFSELCLKTDIYWNDQRELSRISNCKDELSAFSPGRDHSYPAFTSGCCPTHSYVHMSSLVFRRHLSSRLQRLRRLSQLQNNLMVLAIVKTDIRSLSITWMSSRPGERQKKSAIV